MSEPRLVEVRQHILKRNDASARALRARFRAADTYVISLVSSPGAGKTAFLEKVLGLLRDRYHVAALVGDLATDNDARRLARSQVPVKQITTGTVCHLEADMVAGALEGWRLEELDFLFLENVGNLVCPSSYDLGEDLRAVIFSVADGEDKHLKYQTIFNTSDVALITKCDLAAAVTGRPRWPPSSRCAPACGSSRSPRGAERAWRRGAGSWRSGSRRFVPAPARLRLPRLRSGVSSLSSRREPRRIPF